MNLASTIDLYAYGTSEGVSKAWDARGRGRKTDVSTNLVQYNGWIKPSGKWRELHDGETHSTVVGAPDEAVRKGWIRVEREEPYFTSNKTGKIVMNFQTRKMDSSSRRRIRDLIERLHPEVEKVGIDDGKDYSVYDVEDARKKFQ